VRRVAVLAGRLVALGVIALGAAAPVAAADQIGPEGRVVGIEMRAAGSDDRSTAQGSIKVRRGSAKPDLYEWGGTACPAAKLTEIEIGMLERAFHNRTRTLVAPRFKSGETSGVRCLVGFELRAG